MSFSAALTQLRSSFSVGLLKVSPPFHDSIIAQILVLVKSFLKISQKNLKKISRTGMLYWYGNFLCKEYTLSIFYEIEEMKLTKQEKYRSVILYKTVMSLMRELLKRGQLTEDDYRQTSTILSEKCGLDSCSIFLDIPTEIE